MQANTSLSSIAIANATQESRPPDRRATDFGLGIGVILFLLLV